MRETREREEEREKRKRECEWTAERKGRQRTEEKRMIERESGEEEKRVNERESGEEEKRVNERESGGEKTEIVRWRGGWTNRKLMLCLLAQFSTAQHSTHTHTHTHTQLVPRHFHT